MKVWKANLMLLTVAMIWGVGFVATDHTLAFLTPLQMQIFRFGIGAIVLALVFYKRLSKINKKTIIYGSVLGIVFFIAMSFQTFGLNETTVPKNAFITVTNVIFVPLILLLFFKKRPEFYLIIGIIIMLIGFFFLMFDVNVFDLGQSLSSLKELATFNFGDFLTLLCAIAFAFHFVLAGRFVKDEDPFMILMFQLIVSTILSVVLTAVIDGNPMNIEVSTLVDILPALLFLAIFSSVLSFGMQLYAQQFVPASNTAIICSLESLFATISAVLFGLSPLTLSLVVASVIITIGVIYAETGFKFVKQKRDD